MAINRGKQFENLLKEQFEKIPNISIDRLYDVTTGYKNQNNPCDFIVYRAGNLNYFECKAIHGNTLNFKSHIRENQWDKLLAKSKIYGVNAGIICWFIDNDKTIYVDIEYLEMLRESGYKSFNINKDIDKIPLIELEGKKKRILFEYNLKKFLEEISYE